MDNMIEKLKAQINKDLKIDKTKLDNEAAKNPHLVQKYLDIYTQFLRKLKVLDVKYQKLYRTKMIYYKNEWDLIPDTLKELETFIAGDEEIIELKAEIREMNIMVKYMESVVQNFRDKAWAIKNILDWHKFTEGVN